MCLSSSALRCPQKRIVTSAVCYILNLGFCQSSAIEAATYFTMRPVPAEQPAAQLLIRDVTIGVDQQMAAMCVCASRYLNSFFSVS